jgi:hypothetical protein
MTHQSVVRIQGNAEFLLIENLEWMLRQAGRSASVGVAEQTDFQGDAFVENVLS